MNSFQNLRKNLSCARFSNLTFLLLLLLCHPVLSQGDFLNVFWTTNKADYVAFTNSQAFAQGQVPTNWGICGAYGVLIVNGHGAGVLPSSFAKGTEINDLVPNVFNPAANKYLAIFCWTVPPHGLAPGDKEGNRTQVGGLGAAYESSFWHHEPAPDGAEALVCEAAYWPQPLWETLCLHATRDVTEVHIVPFSVCADVRPTNWVALVNNALVTRWGILFKDAVFGARDKTVRNPVIRKCVIFPRSVRVDTSVPMQFQAEPVTGAWSGSFVTNDPAHPNGGVQWVTAGPGLATSNHWSASFAQVGSVDAQYDLYADIFDGIVTQTLSLRMDISSSHGYPTNLTMSVPPGYSSIANPFNRGSNSLAEVFASLTDADYGVEIFKWDALAQFWGPSYTFLGSGVGWSPSDGILAPGEGAFIYNPNPNNLVVTFTGVAGTLPPPSRPSHGFNLLSAPVPQPFTISALMPPIPGDEFATCVEPLSYLPDPWAYDTNFSFTIFSATNRWLTATGAAPVQPFLPWGKSTFIWVEEDNTPPTISFLDPTNGEPVYAGPTTITVEATDPPPGGILQVEFFEGTNSLGLFTPTPNTNLFKAVWNAKPGTYRLSAVATDMAGNTGTNSVFVGVQPTRVSLSAAGGGTLKVNWPGGGTLLAADTLTGPWRYLRGVSSPYVIAPVGARQFYRVVANDPLIDQACFNYFASTGGGDCTQVPLFLQHFTGPCPSAVPAIVWTDPTSLGRMFAYNLQNNGCSLDTVVIDLAGAQHHTSVLDGAAGGSISGFYTNAVAMLVYGIGGGHGCDFNVVWLTQ